ncbi:MAG: tetraacyldisaccharide 4'-kinase [Methylotenera sp.]|nr:tetraacyldisaccharide 4'-kinase [Methylotenera sp.]MSP99490.1 tetraacyldisaccharide 4'-kinase [Methylotenera sp.]
MSNWFQTQWASFTLWHILLIPLAWFFCAAIYLRRFLYRMAWLKTTRLSVPVIIVGNISVGGTGKTPLVIWLAEQLQFAGFKPGIISRGYKGTSKQATAVLANSNPQQVGDEPVLIAKRSHCPVTVGADRVAAGQALLQANPQCNVIISDDGLQHYALQRDIELALVDSNRQFINQYLLPAGPLRERISRLQSVDALVDSGSDENFRSYLQETLNPVLFSMQLQGVMFESLVGLQVGQPASYFSNKNLVAMTGIGNPERFFKQLSGLGLQFESKIFADHHAFSTEDLAQFAHKTILMTEKDAVKCLAFAPADAWYLPVSATVGSATESTLMALILQKLRN